MQLYKNPDKKSWPSILARPAMEAAELQEKVRAILEAVREGGDRIVREYTAQFDGVDVGDAGIGDELLKNAGQSLSPELRAAIHQAAANITKFHELQKSAPEIIETMPGVRCWRKSVGIEKVGLYIPGGSAPLFSTLLMLAIPARIAGCRDIILCTPPGKDGKINDAVLFAAQVAGVTRIFRVGGVQAIAAMAYGTETIPKVHKIFGPGNQYVTAAKQLVQQQGLAIDMPAGPSEVAVYVDESCDASFVAADLLSQAEHGADSQVLLVSCKANIVEGIQREISRQLDLLPRKEVAAKALQHSKIVVLDDAQLAMELLNEYAPEHLILACRDASAMADKVLNAGSVFIGHYSPESVGDYASGTNHTLPTNGYAKAYSGVSVDSFVKKITFQELSEEGLKNIGPTVELMAAAEGLEAHKNAVSIRINSSRKDAK